MIVQMLGRYIQRRCTVLMAVLMVMVVRTLLRLSLALLSNPLGSQLYKVSMHSLARDLESGMEGLGHAVPTKMSEGCPITKRIIEGCIFDGSIL